jgi:hypothetical protein
VLPAILIDLAPLIATAWGAALARKAAAPFGGLSALLLLAVLVASAWIGWRPLWRAAEQVFWSLNSLAVQPGYAICREGLQHLAEHQLGPRLGPESHARLRAVTAAGAGLIVCAAALWVVTLAWPAARWVGDVGDLVWPQRLIVPALANAVVLVGGYHAAAALAWGLADATMDQPRDLRAFDAPPPGGRTWRTCLTCTPSASATDSASRADALGRAAIPGWSGCWPGSRPSMPSDWSTWCSSPAT